MNATLIGVDPQTADLSTQAVNLGWPDATIKVATTAVEGLERVERESPDVVLLHTDITDMAWGIIILELRRLTDSPILVLGHSRVAETTSPSGSPWTTSALILNRPRLGKR